MQLDKRLPRYAKMISKNADILLCEDCCLTPKQRKKVLQIKHCIKLFFRVYGDYIQGQAIVRDKQSYNRFIEEILHDLRTAASICCASRYILDHYTEFNRWSEVEVDAWFHLQQYAILLEDTIMSYNYPQE